MKIKYICIKKGGEKIVTVKIEYIDIEYKTSNDQISLERPPNHLGRMEQVSDSDLLYIGAWQVGPNNIPKLHYLVFSDTAQFPIDVWLR